MKPYGSCTQNQLLKLNIKSKTKLEFFLKMLLFNFAIIWCELCVFAAWEIYSDDLRGGSLENKVFNWSDGA